MTLPNTAIEQIAPQVDWTLIVVLVIVLGIISLGLYLWVTGRIKRPQPRSADS